uniref:Uncharacterized protein n=1 Tax=Meloidogyne javanica TaxID=6303 RepID=A0A915M7G9_MELJA
MKITFYDRNTLHINGTNALDFLQALSDKNLISKIREQSNVDKEYFEESVNGAWLEDYLGVLALNIDLGIEVPLLNRDIAFGMLYRRDYPVKCRKEKDQCKLFNNATLIERYACKQVIECWSRIPAPEHNPKSKDEIVGCNAKFIDEVKDNPNIPIANVTKIRRNNDKSWEKLDKIEKEIDTIKNDRPTQKFLVKTQQAAIKYSDEIDLAYDKMNSTLYEAIFKLNDAIKKAEKTNDEEDLMAVEIALDEFSKTLQAAVTFDNEYHWAYNSILAVHLKMDMIVDLATGKDE